MHHARAAARRWRNASAMPGRAGVGISSVVAHSFMGYRQPKDGSRLKTSGVRTPMLSASTPPNSALALATVVTIRLGTIRGTRPLRKPAGYLWSRLILLARLQALNQMQSPALPSAVKLQ